MRNNRWSYQGFVLRIGAEREDPLRGGEREPTLTTTNGDDDRSGQARGDSRTNFRRDTTDHMDDRRSESEPEENDDDDDEGEVFFPIQAPAKRFLDPTNVLSDDPTCVAQGAEITAESLEGIWCVCPPSRSDASGRNLVSCPIRTDTKTRKGLVRMDRTVSNSYTSRFHILRSLVTIRTMTRRRHSAAVTIIIHRLRRLEKTNKEDRHDRRYHHLHHRRRSSRES